MTKIRHAITPILDIGYEEYGDSHAIPIILLHGFPYDVRSWDGVIPDLVKAKRKVYVPYLRGYGPTKFLSEKTPRMAQQAAIAQDVIDFADALNIDQFALAGFDWGNRAACISSILFPERVKAQVAIGGYSVFNILKRPPPSSAFTESMKWYQWYFNTEHGRDGLTKNRRGITRYLWETWSPTWHYTDEIFERSALSFDNPDFVDVVIHSYRHRHMNAPGEDRFEKIEKELSKQPVVPVPAIILLGEDSGFGTPPNDAAEDYKKFSKLESSHIISGAGHDLPVQRPHEVSKALLELL